MPIVSDRNLISAGPAFSRMLSSLLLTTRRTNQRIRWTGSVRSVVFDSVNSPIALPNAVVTGLVSLPLDPGRWLITAGLYTSDTSSSGQNVYRIDGFINLPGLPPFGSSSTGFTASPGFFTGEVVTISRAATLTQAGSVSLTAMSTGAVTTATVRLAYIVAVPF